MADACFTARATTREHVHLSITKLTLLTNASGQYNHDHATTFIAGIQRSGRSPGGLQLSVRKQETAHAAGA